MPVINWEEIEKMLPEDIENIRVATIKELQVMEDNHQIVQDEFNDKARKIMELQIQKKDLDISLSKSKHAIGRKKKDLEILTTKFWASKRNQ